MLRLLEGMFFRKETPEYFWKIRGKFLRSKNIISKSYYRYQHKKMMLKHNSHIPLTSEIGSMPVFPHGIDGIFVSKNASIGKNCTLFHQVTIGSNTLKSTKKCGAPKIGDNVFIGCGAKIIGGITIGNNVRIGANCVVVEDIPDNCTVVMPKPRIIKCDVVRDNKFIHIAEYNRQNANSQDKNDN